MSKIAKVALNKNAKKKEGKKEIGLGRKDRNRRQSGKTENPEQRKERVRLLKLVLCGTTISRAGLETPDPLTSWADQSPREFQFQGEIPYPIPTSL